jgi:hypothetical protein
MYIMKFSPETVKMLKTFSSINTNLLFKEGNRIQTKNQQQTIVADVLIAEDIPQEFGIYDLTEFLGVLSLFTDAEVKFSGKAMTISEGKSSIKYYGAEPALLVTVDRQIKFGDPVVECFIPASVLSTAIKTAGVIRSTDITIEGNGSEVIVSVSDLKKSGSNSFKVVVGETTQTFKANLKVENLKMSPGDYDFAISAKRITRWSNKNQDATFFVALEETSTLS